MIDILSRWKFVMRATDWLHLESVPVLFTMIFESAYDIKWFALITTHRRLTSSQLETIDNNCCLPIVHHDLLIDVQACRHIQLYDSHFDLTDTQMSRSFVFQNNRAPLLSKLRNAVELRYFELSEETKMIVVNLRLWVPNNGE